MIPSDLASRVQSAEAAIRPLAPVQEITGKLSAFTVGQRMTAEIQALLPNGSYRALVAQRDMLLALPFPAQSGDALELEVVESDGRLALAVLSRRGSEGESGGGKDAATISRAGQLIGRLLSQAEGDGKAVPLNAAQPLAPAPPGSARELLPLLKEAIAKSGMFYESHQAEWIEGRLARAELLREPQGQLSGNPENPVNPTNTAPALPRTIVLTDARAEPELSSSPSLAPAGDSVSVPRPAGQVVAAQIQNIVHQQLEALANQTFVWQGEVWPGQELRWEIEEGGENRQEEDGKADRGWRTRLDLSFPLLGKISARFRLHEQQVSLALCGDKNASLDLLRAEANTLRQALEEAGLVLASLRFEAPSPVSHKDTPTS